MLEMLTGNDAVSEAAVRAGCRFYAGYPITPSTEILENLSHRLEEVGGAFVQAESELAGINMIIGAASCGVMSLTASSGPGMSLKQEGISVLSDEQIPAVIVNMVRYGNGIGTLLNAQCDYLRETRGGGNGDYRVISLCPSSVQEAADLTVLAFELAEKYRMVVLIMGEADLAHMREPAELPEMREPHRYPWGFDGAATTPLIGIFDRDSRKEAVELNEKYDAIKANEQRWESNYLEDADYVMVAYGIAGRTTIGAVEQLRAEGYKVGYIRPITAWPFPVKAFEEVNPNVKGFMTVELNATGQMIDDVALTLKTIRKNGDPIYAKVPVYTNPYVFGMPATKTIIEDFKKMVNGEMKEVY